MLTMTPLVNHRKRKQNGSRMNDCANIKSKRRRLDSDVLDENKVILKCEDNPQEFRRMSRPRLLPKRGIASMKGSFDSSHHNVSDGLDVNQSVGGSTNFMKDKVPRSLRPKKSTGETESYDDKRLSLLSCGAISHNNLEPEDSCAMDGKIKRMDTDMNQPVKNEPLTPDSTPSSSLYPVLPQISNVVLEGYVHRMANLNARACVAAYLEPDKKASSRRRRRGNRWCKNKANSKSNLKYRDDSDESAILSASSKQVVLNTEEPVSNPVILNVNGVENVIPVITFSGMKMPMCAVVVEGLDDQQDDGQVPYNTLGLLHNGDTLYPHARVFLEGSHELHLPSRIVPTLIPARQSTVRRAVEKAASFGVARYHKKPSKRKNNGWCPLGEPIKVIDNQTEGLCKKYYAGIKRKNEEIYVRDCVVINSGTEKRKNPYVAKIGSIWREPDGALMMTTFWYYQPDDFEVRHAGIECVEKEILASQHHDTNSVACIEDKCYVVGLSQYCRYHASVIKNTISNQFGMIYSNIVVPPLPTTATALCHNHQSTIMNDIDLIKLDPTKQQQEILGPSLSELQQVDSSLVFLCYRGFNHIASKLQNGKTAQLPRL